MDIDEIKDYINLLEESKLNKLHLKKGDDEILLEKSSINQQPTLAPILHTPEQKIIEKENIPDKTYITSPMVGTFYISPSPSDPHFVKVGDVVAENTVVAIVEAMKVMNEVKAGINGTIKEVVCNNSQPVEYGTKLFVIEPN